MRHPPRLLLATADPLLNERFAATAGATPVSLDCETPGECLERAASERAGWILLSPALAPVPGTLAPLVAELGANSPGLQPLVAVAPGQLSAGEVRALRQAGAKVVALPEGPVPSMKALLRAEITAAEAMASAEPLTATAPIHRPGSGPLPPKGERSVPDATAMLGAPQGQASASAAPLGHTVLMTTPGGSAVGSDLSSLWQAAAPAPQGVQAPLEPPPSASAAPAPAEAPAPWPGPPPRPTSLPALAPVNGTVLRQRVVAFWGGKPGTGRSTLLVAVSDLISRMPGVRVCSVDLNPLNSSLAPLLRKEAEISSWWRLGEAVVGGSLTPQSLRESLIPVRPGWALLTGPGGSDHWCSLLTAQVVGELVAMLTSEFDYILLDLPAGRGPVADAGLARAQQVLFTVSAFFPDVLDTARLFQQLVTDGLLSRERCALILSPWVDSSELPASDVSACFGLPAAAQVPLAPAAALAAARSGRPVTQLGTADAQAFASAAAAVAGVVTGRGMDRQQRRTWFGH